ncbi:MAG: lipoyl(octanoyl) transferase LipB [Bacteroidia bacterium]|nr:lipoyl(octanoyl) transferase LipB [Bacteroidia bacterium]
MAPQKNKHISLINLGLIDYKEAWDYQEKLFNEVIEKKLQQRTNNSIITPNYLILCQHPHVYTLGKSGHQEYLLLNDDELKKHGANYYKINRGGDITYHGPGQLVAYPILDLDNFFTDIHKYLRYLEEVIINLLKKYNLAGDRFPGYTGVWLDPQDAAKARKICAMGVRCSRWVTMHGLALNVNTDLSYFGHIIPCGIKDKDVTGIEKELNQPISMQEVEKLFITLFEEQFSCKIETLSTEINL